MGTLTKKKISFDVDPQMAEQLEELKNKGFNKAEFIRIAVKRSLEEYALANELHARLNDKEGSISLEDLAKEIRNKS